VNSVTEELGNESKGYDWPALLAEFMTVPNMTVPEFAEFKDIPYASIRSHTRRGGDWINKRNDHYRKIHQITFERIAGIIADTRENDLSSFKALEERLKSVVLKSLELLFPPEDAPLEAIVAATARLEEMSADKLSTIINTGMRTLTETGRHRRLLSGESTAIFARAEAPDVMLPIPMEEAKALEMRTRMAQVVMNAIDRGEPLDVDFAVMDAPETVRPSSPDGARLPVDSI